MCPSWARERREKGMKKQFFSVTGIPHTLKRRPEHTNKIITIEQVETIMESNSQIIIPVLGDCLEEAQVMDGGWVAVDFTRYPAPPRYKSKGGDGSEDLCLCHAVYPGQRRPAVMAKAYLGVWGSWHLVGTHYKRWKDVEPRMDVGMEAKKIFGVIYASWDADGQLLWQREPDSFPEELGSTPTIRVGNAGAPVSAEPALAQGKVLCPCCARKKGECDKCLTR